MSTAVLNLPGISSNLPALNVQGCLTFFMCSDGVSRVAVRGLLNRLNISAALPRARTPLAALRRAIGECVYNDNLWPKTNRKNRLLIRPLDKRQGYALVEESADYYTNKLVHTQVGYIKMLRDGTIEFSSECQANQTFCDNVVIKHQIFVDLLSKQALSDLLYSVLIRNFDCVTLKPGGGLYQFPEKHYDSWVSFCQEINGCVVPGRKEPVIYTLKHDMDEQAASAIIAAIKREVSSRSEEIKEDIYSGGLKERTIKKRRKEAESLLNKVRQIETLCSTSLPELHGMLDNLTEYHGGLSLLDSATSGESDES